MSGFIKNEITRLDKNIRAEREKGAEADHNLPLWIKLKKNYEIEYTELLDDLKKEDPELESFIVSEPVTYSLVQDILPDNSLLINYFFCGGALNIWTITADSIGFCSVDMDERDLEGYINRFIKDLKGNASYENSGNILWNNIVRPVADKINSARTIIFVPDGCINSLPFNYLINFLKNDEEFIKDKNVLLAPGLSGYYYSFLKRKIKKPKLLWRKRIQIFISLAMMVRI